ncbi:MAG: KpsF/GutQ family sugar-phosphate isomerase [Bacteroidetes bacterium]|nr:MAG: KpsF/GutQ family sugar-phosphate isomerase [Bacteroidota bacterium]
MNDQQIIAVGLSTLAIEETTIAGLRHSINADFVRCVRAIYAAKGRLVASGVGKSAIIAQKIVATLNSTGTPALFMHAADAIHGDLGMIRPYDLVLCLSKSGETAEIKALAPLVKHLGNELIGMTSRRDSTLAQRSDYLLHTPIAQEADPNNLAPTASTTAQMAMGDALATALLQLRGFTPADFAQYHPGGALGKRLYLRVADLYPRNARPVVQPDTDLQATILEMTAKCLGATAVVDTADQLLGIITDGDLRRQLERRSDLSNLQAKDLMTLNPKTITADALAVLALEKMRQHSISQLIVVDEQGQYLGFVHLHDLIREGLI